MLLYNNQVILYFYSARKEFVEAMMELGICATLEESNLVKDIGYSYLELNIGEIAAKSENEYKAVKEFVTSLPVPVCAFNCLFPGGFCIVGTEVNYTAIKKHLEKAFFRAKELGGEIIVFGSGKARNIPDKFAKTIADEQMITFLKLAGDIAQKNDITVVLEPLPTRSTNFVNTGREGLRFVKAINHSNVGLLIDYWHLCSENESPNIVLDIGKEYLKHVHIANPAGGIFPKKTDSADYAGFITRLKRIEYDGGVSIEAISQNFKKDALESYTFLIALLSDKVPVAD
jgi:D-psicose/D-tagatose/L-ribulose 3-epimerase